MKRMPLCLVLVIPMVGCVSTSRHTDLETRFLATKHLLEESRTKNKSIADVNRELRARLDARGDAMNDLSSALRQARVESATTDQLRLERDRILVRLSDMDRANVRLNRTNREISAQLDDAFMELAGRTGIEYAKGSGRLQIGSELLFESGDASLSTRGQELLVEVGRAIVAGSPDKVRIEGHTDSDPVVRTLERWPRGNWELSGERALVVLIELRDRAGVSESILSFCGRGPYEPVADNSVAGKRKNRRVEIFVEGGEVDVP